MTQPIPRASLKKRMLKSGSWNVLDVVAGNALRLLSNLIVTRFLLPEAFGVMMFATTILTAFTMISDIGIHRSIVREADGGSTHFLRVAWSVKIRRGLLMTAGVWLVALGFWRVAPHVAQAGTIYADPALPGVFLMISLAPFLAGLEATNKELAAREFNYARIVLVTLATKIAAMIVVIGVALISPTVWALLAGTLLSSLLMTLASHLVFAGPRMRWERDPEIEGRLWHFGKFIIGSSTFTFLAQNADRFILGAVLGAAQFGIYAVALIWITAGGMVILRLLDAVAYSAIAEVIRERPAQLPQFFRKVQRLMDFLCVAGALAAFFGGPFLMSWLYPDHFGQAAEFVQILSLMFLVLRYDTLNTVLVNLGDSRSMMVSNGIRAVSVCALLPLGYALWGLKGALLAKALSPLASQPYIMYRIGKFLDRRTVILGWIWAVLIVAAAVVVGLWVDLPPVP